MTRHALIRGAVDVFWIRLPKSALALTGLGGAALADGSYLRAWPPVAALAPPGAMLLGLVLGILHPGELYTYSLVVMGILGIISALGAGLGCWALVGFAFGDLLLSRRDEFSRLAPSFDEQGLRAVAALALSYVLLAGLLVLAPILASAVRLAVTDYLHDGGHAIPVAGVALMATHVALAFLWTQSTPFLIRPVWSYFGGSPEVPAIEPLQQRGWILAVLVAAGVAIRLYLERLAARRLDPLGMPGLVGGLPAPAPWWLAVAGRTLFVTFLLSGLLTSLLAMAATAVALAGIFFVHIRVLPAMPGYIRTVGRVPLILRVVGVVLLAYGAGTWWVQRAVDAGSQSFSSLVVATLVSLAFVALLLPERPHNSGSHDLRAAA